LVKTDQIASIEKAFKRERRARKEAERILEMKSLELFEMNRRLKQMNAELEDIVDDRVKELKMANEELRQFAYVVSHDLKAPLRGIGSLAQWIVEDYFEVLDEEGQNKLNLIQSRVNRMQDLINGILEYSKVGKVKQTPTTVNLNLLVKDVIDLLNFPENITIDIETNLPTFFANKNNFFQIFQNLLSNALKYIDKPYGFIKIGCKLKDDLFEFYVGDNGPGIEEQYFDKIFKMFQTLQARDSFESTGVGLPIVKKIVHLYKGNIGLSSEIGVGSTFYFTIPQYFEVNALRK